MIYFDHNATTAIMPRVMERIVAISDKPLNPSSVHGYGRNAKHIINITRKAVAGLLGLGDNYQVVFTSSGTEANNLLMHNFYDADLFISSTEHPSVHAFTRHWPGVYVIRSTSCGLVDLIDLEERLATSTKQRKLVSVMFANNETGIIQPISAVVEIAKKYGAFVHSDLVQAVGKCIIGMDGLGIDFATISGHKFGAPLGVGALVARKRHNIKPDLIGGGQEFGIRSGTENVLSIAGLGYAIEGIQDSYDQRIEKMRSLRDYFEQKLLENFASIEIVGFKEQRLPNTSLFIDKRKEAQTQVMALDLHGIAVSSGSACSSGKVRASHVLLAMGYGENQAAHALRVSFGPSNSFHEIDKFIEIFYKIG